MSDAQPAATPPSRPVAGPDLPVPAGFVRDELERSWSLAHPTTATWTWLCDPATFTATQVPPWRVEFLDPGTGAPAGFVPGVLTTHHGPLLHFCGVIGEVRTREYRDLQYTYGAYAVSMRLFRPVRLEFWLEEEGVTGTLLRLRVTADVRPRLQRLWRGGNRLFWRRFGTWADKGIAAKR